MKLSTTYQIYMVMKKIKEFFLNVLKVIGNFLKKTYAAQLTIGIFGAVKFVLAFFIGSTVKMTLAVIVIVWAGLLAYNEYKQNQTLK